MSVGLLRRRGVPFDDVDVVDKNVETRVEDLDIVDANELAGSEGRSMP